MKITKMSLATCLLLFEFLLFSPVEGSGVKRLEMNSVTLQSKAHNLKIEVDADKDTLDLDSVVLTSNSKKIIVPESAFKGLKGVYVETIKITGVGFDENIGKNGILGTIEILFEMDPCVFHDKKDGESVYVKSSVKFTFENGAYVSRERSITKGDGSNSWACWVKKNGEAEESTGVVRSVENPMLKTEP